jgi:hypothetical protein
MSQENVEIVRRWLWAFENDEDVFREVTHPEIEWAPFEDNHTVSYGLAAAMRIRSSWFDAWAEHHMEIEEVIGRGEDVVASAHMTARGRGSGVEVDVRLHGHFRVRDGLVVYVFEHQERAAALNDAGLQE